MQTWTDESGHWQGLDAPAQAPRYEAIAHMLLKSKAKPRVLDVGCGEAELCAWLKDAIYTGVERSRTAAQRAGEKHRSARIVQSTAEDFSSEELFDAVVFNEMLYYADDPMGLLQKYAGMLDKGGVMLCSIYQKPETPSLKDHLRSWLHPKRPVSNAHCTRMLEEFIGDNRWPILDFRKVTIPGTQSQWHVWLLSPTQAGADVAAGAGLGAKR